jgi:hypothetical protein
LLFAVSHHVLYEGRIESQLGFDIQLEQHLNPSDFDVSVLGARQKPGFKLLVDAFYEVDFLIQGKITGELVAPVADLRY